MPDPPMIPEGPIRGTGRGARRHRPAVACRGSFGAPPAREVPRRCVVGNWSWVAIQGDRATHRKVLLGVRIGESARCAQCALPNVVFVEAQSL
jgi:hypothetical protein